MQKLLQDYSSYNLWANQRIIEMVAPITDQQFEQEILSSFPSVKLTLLHIWDAQLIWLSRMQGTSPAFFPSEEFTGDRQAVIDGLAANSTDYLDFVKKLNPNKLTESCNYKTISGKIMMQTYAELIMHCMNHSTYHRGQILTMLRQLGYSSFKPTDYIYYLRGRLDIRQ